MFLLLLSTQLTIINKYETFLLFDDKEEYQSPLKITATTMGKDETASLDCQQLIVSSQFEGFKSLGT